MLNQRQKYHGLFIWLCIFNGDGDEEDDGDGDGGGDDKDAELNVSVKPGCNLILAMVVRNKLAKARKTRTSPSTLGLQKVWAG